MKDSKCIYLSKRFKKVQSRICNLLYEILRYNFFELLTEIKSFRIIEIEPFFTTPTILLLMQYYIAVSSGTKQFNNI